MDWWPIARDCFIYGLNTIILMVLAWGGEITFAESCIMMGFLVIYYVVTFNNNKFMPAIRVFVEDKLGCCFSTRYGKLFETRKILLRVFLIKLLNF